MANQKNHTAHISVVVAMPDIAPRPWLKAFHSAFTVDSFRVTRHCRLTLLLPSGPDSPLSPAPLHSFLASPLSVRAVWTSTHCSHSRQLSVQRPARVPTSFRLSLPPTSHFSSSFSAHSMTLDRTNCGAPV